MNLSSNTRLEHSFESLVVELKELETNEDNCGGHFFSNAAQFKVDEVLGSKRAPSANELFRLCIYVTLAKLLSGMVPETTEYCGEYYVFDPKQGVTKDSIEDAIDGYSRGVLNARKKMSRYLLRVADIYKKWLPSEFGVKFTKNLFKYLLDPHPIFLPFDYCDRHDTFVSRVMGYPPGFKLDFFEYLKGDTFVRWYSSNKKNDSLAYANWICEKTGLMLSEALEELGSHEWSHLIMDPMVRH